MKMSRLATVAVAIAAIVALVWWLMDGRRDPDSLTLYGNIDLRQVSLAFNSGERVISLLVEEGDVVRQGEMIAELDRSRLEPQVARAEAEVAAQRAAVARLRSGSRPEEIERARAELRAAEADAANYRLQFERLDQLVDQELASQQELDSARAAMDGAEARVNAAQNTLGLLIIGPREEDILQAEAQLSVSEAQLALLRRELAEVTLVAPADGVVRSRLLEVGDLAFPDRPVISLAIMDPKWVRAYATASDLGRIRPGMQGSVKVDTFPDREFEGRIGFISPVAEFTPQTVQTEDLRTSLVYQVRVFVEDPNNELRLGMPASVHLDVSAASDSPEEGAAPHTPEPEAGPN
jgi:HlyD family secretion protein